DGGAVIAAEYHRSLGSNFRAEVRANSPPETIEAKKLDAAPATFPLHAYPRNARASAAALNMPVESQAKCRKRTGSSPVKSKSRQWFHSSVTVAIERSGGRGGP